MPGSALTDLLASYVPRLIQERVVEHPAPIDSPVTEDFQSVVLFADISGFTLLTERLAERGPTGVETLARLLNEYFGQLIDIIHEYGGDVVKFAGDAVIAIFPFASRAGTADSVLTNLSRQWSLRAAECALRINEKLANYKIEGSSLYLKLAISTGHITTAHIGGVFNRWEFLITGLPLVELGIANNLANAGEILLTPSAWNLIRADCKAAKMDFEIRGQVGQAAKLEAIVHPSSISAPREKINIPAEAEISLRAYIPGAIINRLTAGQAGWIAELRRVTVLFINLPDLDQSTELEFAQNIARVIQRSVYRYEGSINKINVDDKGITIVAAFGLPPLSHEDDPLRGVQAALMIRKELINLNVRSYIGVTTGRIFCGSIGNSNRREYTIIGNIVNMSARLMAAASRQIGLIEREGIPILCDRATYDSSKDEIEFESLPPQQVKGRTEAVEVFHPLEQKKSVIRPTTELIGRQEEKTLLANALQELHRGAPLQVVILHGEPGIGKSRLIEDLARQAESLHIKVLAGAGDSVEKINPYHAWRPIFDKIFGIGDIVNDSQMSESLREEIRSKAISKLTEVDPELLRFASLLDVVLPTLIPDNEYTSAMTGEIRGGNIRELLARILQHEARKGPLLIVMEDIHWLDSASWTLLEDVYHKVRPLLVALTTRPLSPPIPLAFKEIVDAPETKFIRLEAMMLDDVEALVCQRLGVKSIPPQVAKLVREKSEGHPFFAEELAYALRDSGVLVIKGQECTLSPQFSNLEGIMLPDNLQAAITSRIDSLNPQQQLALKVASVIGRIFAYRMLEAVHPIEADRPALPSYMETLTRMSLTLIESEEPDLAYIFKHAVTQEVAYNLMLYAQRRQLHQSVAEWIEHSYEQDISSYYSLLAYHWSLAAEAPDPSVREKVVGKAIEYLEKAGDQSLNNFANAEAIQFFKEALRFADELKLSRLRLGRWYRKLGDAYLGLGALDEAKNYMLKAMETLGLPLPRSELGQVGALLSQVARQVGHRLRPGLFLNKKLDEGQEGIRHELVWLCQQLSVVQFLNGDPNPLPMMFAVTAGMNIAETMQDSAELANMYAQVAAVSGFIPLRSQLAHYKNKWQALAKKYDHPTYYIYSVMALATVDSGLGKWEEIKPDLEKAVAICDQIGNNRQMGETLAFLACNAMIMGEEGSLRAYNERLRECSLRRENPVQIVWVKQLESYVSVREGKLEHALKLADEAIEIMEKSLTAEISDYVVRAVKANALWKMGRHEEAWDIVKRLQDKLTKASVVDYSIYQCHAQLTEVICHALERAVEQNAPKAEKSEIEAYARLAIKNLRKYCGIFTIGEPALQLLNGYLALCERHPDKARKHWITAAEKAHAFPMYFEEGFAYLALARNTKRAHAERERSIERSIQAFEKAGYHNWVKVVREL